jgi:hypothetical protein
MKEERLEDQKKKQIPSAIRKTKLVGETEMSKRNRKALEMIKAYRGSFG